ncbi:MAG: hypothetical protein HOH58_11140, partial [Opitutaceae bacterium]|nr:hypothetical protein [Opitutaceae bacterium]
MFFGTEESVLEFDGTVWRSWSTSGNAVKSLSLINEDELLVASDGDWGILAITGRERGYRSQPLPQNMPELWQTHGAVIGPAGEWIMSANGGSVVKSPGKPSVWIPLQNENQEIPQLFDQSETVLAFVPGNGFHEWLANKWVRLDANSELGSASRISMAKGSASSPAGLFGTSDGRLFHKYADHISPVDWAVTELLATTGIRFMRRLQNGNLAIATNEQGILLLSPEGAVVQRVDQLRGMESQTVHHLFEDHEFGLWAGTDFGLTRVDLETPYTLFFRRDGLERSFINCMVRHEGRLHIGMDRGAYILHPAQMDKGWNARFIPIPEMEAQVRSLLSTDHGLLIGTNEGLWWLPPSAEVPVQISTSSLQGLEPVLTPEGKSQNQFWWWHRDQIGQGHWNGQRWEIGESVATTPDSVKEIRADGSLSIWVTLANHE